MNTLGRYWLVGFLFVTASFAAEMPVKSVAWSPHGAERGCWMNMGPTGVKTWMRGFQFEVVSVDAGSPADGVLKVGDLVLGVAGTKFSDKADSRMSLGNAIGAAEANDGALVLTIKRDGREQSVTVRLAVMGSFAATWPFGCGKSQRILDAACAYLMDAQLPNGKIVTDGGVGTYNGGLLWLATGDARYFDAARRAVYAAADTKFEDVDYKNWSLGYGGMLLAEYYLATGDTNVLAKLQNAVDQLVSGQMRCGSWGHTGPSAGYGALNICGLPCAITLALAQECGLKVDAKALDRAVSFYGRNADLGAVPYGDHMPGVSLADDNGKNSLGAVLCALVPGKQEKAALFAGAVAMSYSIREEGRTGGFFSMFWGPPSCALAGPEALRTFLDYQTWYYNLCRTWRGSLVLLPYFEALTRFDDSGYIWAGGDSTTAGMALTFALPYRQLRILGAPRSVFSATLKGPLLAAREAYLARRWNEFDIAMSNAGNIIPSEHIKAFTSPRMIMSATGKIAGTAEEKYWCDQLRAAAVRVRASTQQTLQEIESHLAEGDAYRAQEQYLALKRFLGNDDETIVALDKRFADSNVQWQVRTGRQYYEGWQSLRGVGVMSWLPYGEQAKTRLAGVPSLRLPVWETLAPIAGTNSTTPVARERIIELTTTNYAALRVQLRSPRNSHSRVFLNGTQVAEAVRGQRGGYAKIDLDATALGLLRVGTNVMAITSTSEGTDNNSLDAGLDGVRRQPFPAATPGWTGTSLAGPQLPAGMRAVFDRARATLSTVQLDYPPNPAVPERMCVRDSAERFQKAVQAGCDALSFDELKGSLRSPLPYVRYLASQSLTRRGAAGRPVVEAGLSEIDWRVRSASCDALIFMVKKPGKGEKPAADVTVEDAVLAKLTKLLADENAWVRCRAAQALSAVEKPDVAAAALVVAASDPDEWVRAAALGALQKATSDPKVLVAAVTSALQLPGTSFVPVSRAVGLIAKNNVTDASLVPALVFAVENPGEGGGADQFKDVLELLVKLDPDGKAAVPAISRVAAGGYWYDRLRGNPRKRAIELLGEMGNRALPAKSVLEKIAGSDVEKEKELSKAARVALEQITAPDTNN